MKINNMDTQNKICTFCQLEIEDWQLTYTEDAEACHVKCLLDHEQYWKDTYEYFNLFGIN